MTKSKRYWRFSQPSANQRLSLISLDEAFRNCSLGEPLDRPTVYWDHEPISRPRPRNRSSSYASSTRTITARRFMESPFSLSRMHRDHKPPTSVRLPKRLPAILPLPFTRGEGRGE